MAKKYEVRIPDSIIGEVSAYFTYDEGKALLPPCNLNSNRCPIKDINIFRGLAHGICEGTPIEECKDFLIKVLSKFPKALVTSADQQGRTPYTKGYSLRCKYLGIPEEPKEEEKQPHPEPAPVPAPQPQPKEPYSSLKDLLPENAPADVKAYIPTKEFWNLLAICRYNLDHPEARLNVWVMGEKGTGKTLAIRVVSWILFKCEPTIMTAPQDYALEISGYVSPLSGEYFETDFVRTFTNGGLAFFDEVTRSDPGIPTKLNTVLNDRAMNVPSRGMVPMNPRCLIVAADNTTGEGGNEMYQAEVVDESFRSRFPLMMVYKMDPETAAKICPYDGWADFIFDWNESMMKAMLPRNQKFYRELGQIAQMHKAMGELPFLTVKYIVEQMFTNRMCMEDIKTVYNGLGNKRCAQARAVKEVIGE